MVKVFSPWRLNGLSLVRLPACLAVIAALDFLAPGWCLAQTKSAAPAEKKAGTFEPPRYLRQGAQLMGEGRDEGADGDALYRQPYRRR